MITIPKADGWPTRCGMQIMGREKRDLHQKGCQTCQDRRSMDRKKSTGWPNRCGVVSETKRKMLAHRKECQTCETVYAQVCSERQSKAMEDKRLPGGWGDYCSDTTYPTRRKRDRHTKDCEKCQLVIHDIRATVAKTQIRDWREANPDKVHANMVQANKIYRQQRQADPELAKMHGQKISRALNKMKGQDPEGFAVKMKKAWSAQKGSKAEAWLRSSGALIWEEAQISCGMERKQVDFVSPDHRIWVEVDGTFHFKEISESRLQLAKVQARDAMLNEEAIRRGDVTLIRLAMTCFDGASGQMKSDWLTWLTKTLHSPQPGVWCAGELYESVPWANEKCSILKSPTPNTTSCCPTESSRPIPKL